MASSRPGHRTNLCKIANTLCVGLLLQLYAVFAAAQGVIPGGNDQAHMVIAGAGTELFQTMARPTMASVAAGSGWAAGGPPPRNTLLVAPPLPEAYSTGRNPLLVNLSGPTQRSAGEVFRDCPNCPEMVVIPAGTFRMGSPAREVGRRDNEEPRREISIKSLAIGRFEITRGQFAEFVDATRRDMAGGCSLWTHSLNPEIRHRAARSERHSWRDPGFSQADDHPVTCVSWDDARAYVQWLSARTGQPYRLLTEAEWEYAARAGSAAAFSFGGNSNALCRFGNGADLALQRVRAEWSTVNCDDGHVNTAPVGSFTPNAFGLYDMHGNVWEWVQDCFRWTYDTGRTDGRAVEPRVCRPLRVMRGGSWGNEPALLRSAARGDFWAEFRSNVSGIRIARTLP